MEGIWTEWVHIWPDWAILLNSFYLSRGLEECSHNSLYLLINNPIFNLLLQYFDMFMIDYIDIKILLGFFERVGCISFPREQNGITFRSLLLSCVLAQLSKRWVIIDRHWILATRRRTLEVNSRSYHNAEFPIWASISMTPTSVCYRALRYIAIILM